ncbi:MAG: hypothetical protein PHQ86_07285 [Dehalococcoidales bacterium]|nr:hypothetical protein [Dehalococcoidales bacterium]
MLKESELQALRNPKTDEWIDKNIKLMREVSLRILEGKPTEELEAILFNGANQP